MNAESIKKYNLNRNKVNVTLKPMMTTTFVSKYENTALTKFMLKIEYSASRYGSLYTRTDQVKFVEDSL